MYKIDLSGAIAALQNGDIVVYPTDTLYALGADVYNEGAVRRVFKVKKRPLMILCLWLYQILMLLRRLLL